MGDSKVLIIVPAFREEKSIHSVLLDLKRQAPGYDILVIDDGSKDRTCEICAGIDCNIIKHPFNMGYGVSIQTGYKFAWQKGYDVVVQVDGDNQHDPAYIPTLLDALAEGGVDVVVGSRFLDNPACDWPLARKVGINLFSRLVSLITGQRVTDSTSGFQALSRRAFGFFSQLDNFPYDYPDADTLLTLHFAGLKFKEVPVRMRDRVFGQSMTAGLSSLIYVAKMLISILIVLLRKKTLAKNKLQWSGEASCANQLENATGGLAPSKGS
jgi:glycosyltransferase involved in cell wall biosynthesis